MFKTDTVTFGKIMPMPRQRFLDLHTEWTAFIPGSIIVDVNWPEQTFVFKRYHLEPDGSSTVVCTDAAGYERYLFGDAVRLLSLGGVKRRHSKGKRVTTLTSSEKGLSRTERRKIRREQRTALNVPGID
jgi:hypothetical protein